MATTVEVVELQLIVQQQTELIRKQAEDARIREEELTRRHNEMLGTLMQRLLARQGNVAKPVAVQLVPEAAPLPQQQA